MSTNVIRKIIYLELDEEEFLRPRPRDLDRDRPISKKSTQKYGLNILSYLGEK